MAGAMQAILTNFLAGLCCDVFLRLVSHCHVNDPRPFASKPSIATSLNPNKQQIL
jgi:hypothetical protein